MSEINPYAAPQSDEYVVADLAEQGGVWSDGKLLVMARPARLPDRCVKCNVPTTERLKRKLYWHHPMLFLLILISVPIYAIVAVIVQKKAVIHVGVCERHRRKRRRDIAIAWITALSGIGLFFVPFDTTEGLAILAGVILLLFG